MSAKSIPRSHKSNIKIQEFILFLYRLGYRKLPEDYLQWAQSQEFLYKSIRKVIGDIDKDMFGIDKTKSNPTIGLLDSLTKKLK